MYSLVLMAAMTNAGEVPQGIFNRGGCSGATVRERHLIRERVFGGCHGQPIRTALANRPTPVANLWHWFQDHRPHVAAHLAAGCHGAEARYGCSGHAATTIKQVTRTVVRGPLSFSCPGPNCPAPAAFAPMPQLEAGPIREFVKKHEIDRALRMIISHKGLTPEQKAKVLAIDQSRRALLAKALAEPEAWKRSVAGVTKQANEKIADKMGADFNSGAGFQFSGKILQMLIDNLPKILAFVEAILKDLHVISIPLDDGGYLILGYHKVSGAVFYLGIV